MLLSPGDFALAASSQASFANEGALWTPGSVACRVPAPSHTPRTTRKLELLSL